MKKILSKCMERMKLNRIYITGDTHGDMQRIHYLCNIEKLTEEDVIIILGDAGINYYGTDAGILWDRQTLMKESLADLKVKIFCIHGNHERRPYTCSGYKETYYLGGKVWIDPNYPNIIFAKDGEIFDFNGLKAIVIGGAYSVDKPYRLENGLSWFDDEQPDDNTKSFVRSQLEKENWEVDIVLSHTVPFKYRPVDAFIEGVNESDVDTSTEEWLQEIEEKLTYKKWYAGHYHINRKIDRLQIMYEDIDILGI